MKHLAPVLVFAVLTASPALPEKVLLITGGTVVTVNANSSVIDDGAVAIKKDRITAVGPSDALRKRFPDAEIYDAKGKVVMPGLVNAHAHVPMGLFRGIADDLKLMDWLENHIFPAEKANVDEEFVRWGTKLACLEMIRGGTTTFVDMYYFEDAIAEETAACGLRAVLGQTLIDFPAPDFKTWEAATAGTAAFLKRWQDHPLITPAVAPHAPYTVSATHLQEASRMAREAGVPLVMHLAEDRAEVERILKEKNTTPVRYVDSLGILGDHVLAAHMIWPDDEEIAILAERGVGVAHCPQSNMKIAAGIAPVPKLLAAGVDVGLGSDGPASNNDVSIWEEADTAAKLHKVNTGDPTVINAREALHMATLGGARAIGQGDEIGSLEVGKRADIIVVGLDGVHQTPLYNVTSSLIYATKSNDVEAVFVNGKLLYDQGRFLTVAADEVLAKANEYRDRIRQSLAAAKN